MTKWMKTPEKKEKKKKEKSLDLSISSDFSILS